MNQLSTLLAARRILRSWTGERIRQLRQCYTGKYLGIVMGKKPDSAASIVNQLENESRPLSLDEAIALTRLEREHQLARENQTK